MGTISRDNVALAERLQAVEQSSAAEVELLRLQMHELDVGHEKELATLGLVLDDTRRERDVNAAGKREGEEARRKMTQAVKEMEEARQEARIEEARRESEIQAAMEAR